MAEVKQFVRHGWIWIFSILIFFFNTVGVLPQGLTLTLLLTPVWLYFLSKENKLQVSLVLLLPLFLFIPFHIMNGVDTSHYFTSITIICLLLLFVATLYFLIDSYDINFDLIFRDIALLNIVLAIGSLTFLFIPSLKEMVWYMVPISEKIEPIPRLKLFTSEASHYSFLMAPLVIYFYSRALFFRTSNTFIMLAIVTVPLILSFSFGVLIGLFISGLLLTCFYLKRVFSSRRRWLVFLGFLALFVLVIAGAYMWFPDNPIFVRIQNIFKGTDTSARGRVTESFILSHRIAGTKSYLWGIGPGQLNLVGREIFVKFYQYTRIPQVIRIPNACAETIAYFGYIGLALRMIVEWWLFFKTKVFLNPFRCWLFLFVFIYQFTGSYITNTTEYILWILAFSSIFPEFSNNHSSKIRSSNENSIPGEG